MGAHLKICGLTQPLQAAAVAGLGVNAIGVIAVERSARFLPVAQRAALWQAVAAADPTVLNRVSTEVFGIYGDAHHRGRRKCMSRLFCDPESSVALDRTRQNSRLLNQGLTAHVAATSRAIAVLWQLRFFFGAYRRPRRCNDVV